MQADWPVIGQFVTLAAIIVAWVTAYGTARANRATQDAQFKNVGLKVDGVASDVKDHGRKLEDMNVRLARVELKVGLDGK